MSTPIRLAPVILAVVAALVCAPATAVDTGESIFPSAAGSDLDAGRKAVEEKNWNAAIRSLSAAERSEPRSADVQNLLGYAYRNSGKLDLAFKHYERALQLDPRHLGAHEYIGEAYLMAGDLARAEAHLARLKDICGRVCEERDDLNRKIAEYRARNR